MPRRSDVVTAAPELAATARERLELHPFKLLGTLRADGSPRVSGIQVEFLEDGELRAGSMPGSVKVADLDRDGRFQLHGAPAPRETWTGDAKLAGVAAPTGPRPEARYFRLDVREVVTIGVGATGLAVAVWTPERGLRSWVR